MEAEEQKEKCECWNCEGKGKEEIEDVCDCEGCFNGDHEIELDCGQMAFAPCGRCEGNGWINKEVECDNCKGTGVRHDFKNCGKQATLTGEVLRVRRCINCEYSEMKNPIAASCGVSKYKNLIPKQALGYYTQKGIKTLSCCCGHFKYNMTLIVEIPRTKERFEVFSGKLLKNKRRFYKRDKNGMYFISETLKR